MPATNEVNTTHGTTLFEVLVLVMVVLKLKYNEKNDERQRMDASKNDEKSKVVSLY